MANLFNASQLAKITSFFADMLDTTGSSFTIYYTPKWIACANCTTTANSTYNNNIGLHGGPLFTICPQCNGTHKIQQEVSEDIILNSNLNHRESTRMLGPNIKLPAGHIIVRGKMSDFPKLEKSIELKRINNGATEDRYHYIRQVTDGYANLTGAYFVAILERIS